MNPVEKNTMARFRFATLTCLALATLLIACRSAPGQDRLVYGLTLSPSNIDPHVGASSELGIPLTSVYDPLVWRAPDGSFVPGLAARWEVSDDGTAYTFFLRDDVQFHDGTPFNAEAVCFNLERIADPETRSAKAASLLGPFEDCEVRDTYTAIVRFQSPHAPFLDAASQVYLAMASPSAVRQWGEDYQFHQVGTGPFTFVEYVPKDHLTLQRNADYDWAPPFFAHQGPAHLQEVVFRFYVDPATRSPALESGEVQVMGEISPADAARIDADPELELLAVPIPGQPLQMYVNTSRAPTDDLRVRQALLYAVDRQAIIDAVFAGFSPPAYGPLARTTWAYDPLVETLYPYDPAQAGQLLEAAGWRDSDGDGIRDRDGQPLALETVLTSWGLLPEVGQVLQEQYRQVGVRLEMQTIAAYPAVVQAAAEGSYHLIPFNLSASDPHILRTAFHSSNVDGGFNWSKVRDPELDRLLDQGTQTLDEETRADIYRQVQQRVMAQALVIPIRDYVNLNGASGQVTGLRYDAQGWFPWLYDVRIR
ncbi:MAG: ABC transporter substrate-binding protein [Anaerolineae bacterium]|nr:ABC transporter substrate-binding protein [Anaerolineae bacterium]